jgi:DNA modification methylase
VVEDVRLVLGDAREVMRGMADGSVDAVVTDPPYGLREARGKNRSRTHAARATDYGVASWDDRPCPPGAIAEMRRVSRWQIIFGGNFFVLPPSPCWLVWDKLNSGDFADCELAWTNLKGAVRRIQHRWNGMIRDGADRRVHPTQKPLAVMRWCLSFLPQGCTVLDPFMGSGTTGVVCVQTGHPFLGVDSNPDYVALAQRRIEEARSEGPLFARQQTFA